MRKNNVVLEEVLYEDIKIPASAFGMGQYNNSHYFLMPLFNMKSILLHKTGYIGSYIADQGRDCSIEGALHVVFRIEDFNSIQFTKVNSLFEGRRDYKFSYYCGHNDGNLISYVLKSPDKELECYNTLVSGKYSKVPNWYIDRCGSFPFAQITRKRIQGILRKEEWHKNEMESVLNASLGDQELWNKFEPEREVFRYVKAKA